MRHRNKIPALLAALAAAFLIAGCGAGNKDDAAEAESQSQSQDAPTQEQQVDTAPAASVQPEPVVQQQPVCVNCGRVVAIEEHDKVRGNTSPEAIAGAVIGAVAGVMLGSSQFSGDDETTAEIVGGVAGAVAGHQIGKRAATDNYFTVRVAMDNGGMQTIRVPQIGALTVGQKVRVDNGTIHPR